MKVAIPCHVALNKPASERTREVPARGNAPILIYVVRGAWRKNDI